MSDLKDILRKALPEKPAKKRQSSSDPVDRILSGEYLTDSRKVLKITSNLPLNDLSLVNSEVEVIPPTLWQYCSLNTKSKPRLLYIDTENIDILYRQLQPIHTLPERSH